MIGFYKRKRSAEQRRTHVAC